MNILQMVQDVAGSALVNQASGFLGENKSSTQSAINAILPSLLGGLIGKSQQNGGAGAIMDLLNNNNNLDGSMLNNLSGLFSGGESTSMLSGVGGTLLKAVLGDKVGGLVDMVSGFSGLKKSSSNSLMSMAMPLIMSFIGKQVKAKGLGLSGLTSLLSGQSQYVSAAMPSGFTGAADLLGFAGASSATTSAKPVVSKEEKSGGMGWMPWIIGLLALAGLFYFMKGCGGVKDTMSDATNAVVDTASDAGNRMKDGAEAVLDGTKEAANAAGELAKDGANSVGDLVESAGETLSDAAKAAREGLASITFATGSVGEGMLNYLNGKGGDNTSGVFRFTNLNFASGSAAVTDENAQEVDNLAAVLAAYPKVKVEIQGHTDNTGKAESNKTLSQKRADAVQARLVSKGVEAARISTMGYGQDMPTADNATEEGRAQNRRIEVKIVK